MSFELTEDEIDLLKRLTSYPQRYPTEFDNSLNYLATLRIAAKHSSGWAKGSNHQNAINWLKSLQPHRVKTCKGCGA